MTKRPTLKALFHSLSVAMFAVLIGATVAATEPMKSSNPSKLTHHVHVVESGESLSEISYVYYNDVGHSRLIQWANGLPDENYIVTGSELVIPLAPFFLQPHGLTYFTDSFFHRTNVKTGELFLGVYSCRTADVSPDGECPLSARGFVVLRLGENTQADLVFDRADFLAEPEAAGDLGDFEFIDLDGDSDVDLLGEWSQGSANVTTHIAYHYQKGSYTAHEIQSLSLGDFETRRGADGALQFIYYPRYEDEAFVVPWSRDSKLESSP